MTDPQSPIRMGSYQKKKKSNAIWISVGGSQRSRSRGPCREGPDGSPEAETTVLRQERTCTHVHTCTNMYTQVQMCTHRYSPTQEQACMDFSRQNFLSVPSISPFSKALWNLRDHQPMALTRQINHDKQNPAFQMQSITHLPAKDKAFLPNLMLS